MRFSSLLDPVEVARAGGALDAAWARLQRERAGCAGDEHAHQRLASIISGLAMTALDEADLEERALRKFEADAAP